MVVSSEFCAVMVSAIRQHLPLQGNLLPANVNPSFASLCPPSSPPCADPTSNAQRKKLTVGLEDTEDLVSGHALDLGNTVGITEDDTDLGRGETLAGELEDVVRDLIGGDLEPAGRGALVGERRSG